MSTTPLINSIKTFFITNRKQIIIAGVIIIGFFVFKKFYGTIPDNSTKSDRVWKGDLDSLKIVTGQMKVELKSLHQKRTEDSLGLVSLQDQIDQVPSLLKKITVKYEKERRDITNKSFDDRLRFFSGWVSVSKADTTAIAR